MTQDLFDSHASLRSVHFFHYGSQHFSTLVNMTKLRKLCKNEYHRKFVDFVENQLLTKNIPDGYFIERSKRASGIPEVKSILDTRPSRYKPIIDAALRNLNGRERHYVVQKYLVTNSCTDYVVSEFPVWNEYANPPTSGHIDVIEMTEGNPSIILADYKPWCLQIVPPTGQLNFYKILFSQLLEIPFNEIGLLYFDEIAEIYIVDG